jgi:hypothetical protein
VIPLTSLIAAATDRLAVTSGALLEVTTMVVDASRGSAAVVARKSGLHGSKSTLLAPGQRLEDLAGDEEGIEVAADSVQHLSVAQ